MWNIQIDSNEPVYMCIANHIEKMILSQKICPHDPLPSIRKLSESLKVNKDTVVMAYRHAEKRGYVYKIAGKGTFVKDFGDASIEDDEIPKKTYTYDFSQTIISTDHFPVEAFKTSFNHVLTRDRGKAFIYHDPIGYEPLRKVIQSHLKESGVMVDIDRIMIISGAQQGIDIVSRNLLLKNDHIFIENPTYRGALQYFKRLGVRMTGIPYKAGDLDIIHFENELKLKITKRIK